MLIFLGLILLVLGVIVIFASPTLSPIPYFPSNAKDLPLILKALDLKKDTTVFDLGAGDGIIIFAAAKEALDRNLNTQFVAVEMNPILSTILYIRKILHPNRRNIKIVSKDMFKVKYKEYIDGGNAVTVYIYVSPRFIPRIINHLKVLIPQFKLVSYFYPIKQTMAPFASGEHAVFCMQISDTMV